MSSQQLWNQDSKGRVVYWTGTEWVHPYWIRDAAGYIVFWSPQHQQYLIQLAIQLIQVTQPASSLAGVAKNLLRQVQLQIQQQRSRVAFKIPLRHSFRGVASLGLGPSSALQSDPMLESRTNKASGVTKYTVTSQLKGVQSKFIKGPSQWTTDPYALERGVASTKFCRGTGDTSPEAYESLDDRFRVPKDPRKFFQFGRVVMMLQPEPAGETRSAITAVTRDARFGEGFFIKPRRFIVVLPGAGSCTVISIGTYGSQGVAKRGVRKSDHAVVYSTRDPPTNVPTRDEQPSRKEQGMQRKEQAMQPQKIRIDMSDRTDALDPMSRISFAKVYTIEHNVKVRGMGMLNRDFAGDLWSLFWRVQMEHASQQGPQGMKLYLSAEQALKTRPRTDSVAGPSVQEAGQGEAESDDDESDDGSEEG